MPLSSTTIAAAAALLFTSLPVFSGGPVILGKAEGRIAVGEILAQDDFEDLSNWVVQIEPRDGFAPPRVEAKDGWLDCYLPGRGATIWFKQKLKTRLAITYEVVCPQPDPSVKGITPRDINNFWLASDPQGGDLFDATRYSGKFSSYNKIHGYYASTGGGSAGDANRTIRLRRYPREIDGQPAAHLYLNERDGDPQHLIQPDKVMTVQLVAFDDLVQFIVDGKLVYEVSYGDAVQVESRTASGAKTSLPARYTEERFPIYREGHFGFRMVRTHHRYRNFKVYQLEESDTVTVSSIEELRKAVKLSKQRIRMTPGTYVADNFDNGTNVIHFTGSHNHIDLTGVTLEVPIKLIRTMRHRRGSHAATLLLSGDHLTLQGLELENTYPDGKTTVTNFGSYNQNRALHPRRSMVAIRANGDDTTLRGCRLTVRGSTPYGYGNLYGIGGGAVIGLQKHSGILAKGDRAVIEDCHVKMEAFGHAIFFQGGDEILVRGCTVEGELRRSDDLYEEQAPGDLPRRFEYKLQWPEEVHGLPIPRNHMINLAEDGIRAYPGTQHVRVENCRVHKMRAGVKLYLARSAEVYDCVVTDCVIQGYSLPSRGKIVRSSGNAAYGPLLYIHSDRHSQQEIDLTVLPSKHSLGDHPLAALKGANNRVHLKAGKGQGVPVLRPIIMGYRMRFDFLCTDYPKVPTGYEQQFAKHAPEDYRAERNVLINETRNPVVLGKLSRDNAVKSAGQVIDHGRN